MVLFYIFNVLQRNISYFMVLATVVLSGIHILPSTQRTHHAQSAFNPALTHLNAEDLRHINIVARTVYGEARDQSISGQEAIAHVILNRSKQRHKTIPSTIYQRKQFSCWNVRDPNRAVLQKKSINTRAFNKVFNACLNVLSGKADHTKGASYYHVKTIHPYWSRTKRINQVSTIGRHLFYR